MAQAAHREEHSMKNARIVTDSNGTRTLEVQIGPNTFVLPFKLIGGRWVGFLDISGQVALIESAADEIANAINASGLTFDTILNPVSKSNALAHAVAVRLGIGKTVVARKSTDPQNIVRASYRSVTTDKDQVLSLTPDDAEFLRGKRILVMDDVYGGGGTTRALYELARGAEAEIAGHAVVAVEAGGQYPEGLIYLFELPTL